MDVLRLMGGIALIGAVVFVLVRLLMAAAVKASERKKPVLAFFLLVLQFIIFFAGFTLMLLGGFAFVYEHTNLFR